MSERTAFRHLRTSHFEDKREAPFDEAAPHAVMTKAAALTEALALEQRGVEADTARLAACADMAVVAHAAQAWLGALVGASNKPGKPVEPDERRG